MEEERNESLNENKEENIVNESGEVKEEVKEEVKADSLNGEINLKNTATDLSCFKPLNHLYDGFSNIDDEIEKIRLNQLQKLKKSKIIDVCCIIVMMLAFIGVLLVVFLNKDKPVITYIVLGVAVVLIIASFIITSFFNKKDAKSINEYLTVYEDTLDGYLIYGLGVSDPLLCPDGQTNESSFIEAHCFSTINSVDTRSILQCKRGIYQLEISEMAAVVPPVSIAVANAVPTDYINLDGTPYIPKSIDDTITCTTELQSQDVTMVDLDLADEANNSNNANKRMKEEEINKKSNSTLRYALFGRYYNYSFAVSSEESLIIYFMGDKMHTVLPNYLTDFKAVKVPGLRNNIIVFAADVTKSSKFFTEDTISALNDIVPNMVFQSGFISFTSFGTKVGMNLSDDIMDIPLKKRQAPLTIDNYKQQSDNIFKFIDKVVAIKKNSEKDETK